MIGLTQAFFSYAVAKVLGLDERYAVLGGLIPGFSLLLIYSGPLQYEGLLLSFTAALGFTVVVYAVSQELACCKGFFAGYSCSLLLEALTFSYIPLFYPLAGFQGLGLFSSFDPVFNLAVISASVIIVGVLEFQK